MRVFLKKDISMDEGKILLICNKKLT